MCEEPFLFACQALPTDVLSLIRRRNEGVVMLHFAVALFASNSGFVGDLGVDRFDHSVLCKSNGRSAMDAALIFIPASPCMSAQKVRVVLY